MNPREAPQSLSRTPSLTSPENFRIFVVPKQFLRRCIAWSNSFLRAPYPNTLNVSIHFHLRSIRDFSPGLSGFSYRTRILFFH